MDLNFKITIDTREMDRLIRVAPSKADDAISAAAFEGEGYVKRLFNTSPPGRTYTKRSGVSHTASTAGYPPNVDTGKLRNSIYTKKLSQARWVISTGDTEYAPMLEFGTQKIAPRPFMTPMKRWLEGELKRIFDDWLGVNR